MSAATIFEIHLVLGYVPWLLCVVAYVWPRLKAMDRVDAHRAIATLHSFRFFGLVFLLPGIVGPNLPVDFAAFAAYGDFATGLLAMLALLSTRTASALLAVCRRLQRCGGCRHHRRLLPRHPAWSSSAGGAAGRRLRDPDHLRAPADDHARRRVLLAGASSAQGGSASRRGFDQRPVAALQALSAARPPPCTAGFWQSGWVLDPRCSCSARSCRDAIQPHPGCSIVIAAAS